jgi:hypothetical protein
MPHSVSPHAVAPVEKRTLFSKKTGRLQAASALGQKLKLAVRETGAAWGSGRRKERLRCAAGSTRLCAARCPVPMLANLLP